MNTSWTESRRRRVRLAYFVLFLASVAACGAFAQSAAAFDAQSTYTYFSGSLTSDENRSYRPGCGDHAYGSGAHWTTGAGAYGTVAIIAPSGNWIASERNNTGSGLALVAPENPDADKALCRNSTSWQVTVGFTCEAWIAYDHSQFCV